MIVTCESCKRTFRTARSKVGLYAKCPNCGAMCRTTPADSSATGSESSEAIVVLTTDAAFAPKVVPTKVPKAPALVNTSPRSPVKRSSELRLLLISILLAVIVTPFFVAWRLGMLWSGMTIIESPPINVDGPDKSN